jgi:hypothetical protein
VIPTGALAQPLQEPLWLGPAAGVFSSCPGQSDPAIRSPTRRRRWTPCRSLLTVASAQVRCSSDDFASALPGSGQVYATEHGTFRDDEVILLRPGGNGGWNPVCSGGYDESVPMTDPALPDVMLPSWASGDPTIATSGWTFLAGPHWGDVDGACSWVRPCRPPARTGSRRRW